MKKKLYFLTLMLALAFVVVACAPKAQQEVIDVLTEESEEVIMDDGTSMKVPAPGVDSGSVDEMVVADDTMTSDSYQASLVDVSGGSASGTAVTNFKDGEYSLTANFENLPDPAGTDFYEGWVVIKSPLDAISTGRVNKVDGKYVNRFSDGRDLTDYTFYVLTIEPDDGNPAPDVHILEGTLTQ